MSASESNGNGKSYWLTALQTVGFPVVACMGVGWFAYDTIWWERNQMLPAIQDNAKAFQENTEALREVTQAVEHIKPNTHLRGETQ